MGETVGSGSCEQSWLLEGCLQICLIRDTVWKETVGSGSCEQGWLVEGYLQGYYYSHPTDSVP